MTIREIDLMFRSMTPNIKIISRWGSVSMKQENDCWNIGDILDVPVSRYRFVKEVDVEIDKNGREREKHKSCVIVYLDNIKTNTDFYKIIQKIKGKELRKILAAQTAE